MTDAFAPERAAPLPSRIEWGMERGEAPFPFLCGVGSAGPQDDVQARRAEVFPSARAVPHRPSPRRPAGAKARAIHVLLTIGVTMW